MARKKKNQTTSVASTAAPTVDTEQNKDKQSGFNIKSLFKKKPKKDYTFSGKQHLVAFKPNEKYIFHSDYFQIDNSYATILSLFHADGATDNFGVFWGINKIPSGLGNSVSVLTFEQVSKMTEGWLTQHQTQAEKVGEMSINEQTKNGTNTTRGNARKKQQDLIEIASELANGGAYLNVQYRLLVKAKTLDELDEAVEKIGRLYIDRFGTVDIEAYAGEQRRELSDLMAKNTKKLGKGFYFTSQEFAGSYSLVTHGLEDPTGEYVGYMIGDVNNSAVLFDVNNYSHHTVIANEQFHEKLGRQYIANMWGSKQSQSCLLNNNKVVHIILDNTNLDILGPKLEQLTYTINMNQGDINMFEMFGSDEDELSIFPTQMQKLILMAEQAYETTESDRSIIRGSLEEIATQYYIDNRMWRANAQEHRDKLRIVNIPHEEVPKLEMFVSYLDTEYNKIVAQDHQDHERLHAFSVLRVVFRNLLTNNGDLFNTTTTDVIDSAYTGRRVIYDFGKLMNRGQGIAMAQLVNVIAFAVGNLGKGDTVIIHGANNITNSVKEYLNVQFDKLFTKGGRVCYIYNSVEKMLADKEFCRYDKADYTIFGNMTESSVSQYQKLIGEQIPVDLANLITTKSENICYIRRGFDNVVFKQDLSLGLNKGKKKGQLPSH